MPELPEVEAVCRRLETQLVGKRIQSVDALCTRTIRPLSGEAFRKKILGCQFLSVSRRGKYLQFGLSESKSHAPSLMVGHLGMTGRMRVEQASMEAWPHVVAVFDLGDFQFQFQDPRKFGRLTFDISVIQSLGPEPLDGSFTWEHFFAILSKSRRSIKQLLLDQGIIAGVGNIYASEALFCAGLSPFRKGSDISSSEADRLLQAIRSVLTAAINRTVASIENSGESDLVDSLFYHGTTHNHESRTTIKFSVYDQAGLECPNCKGLIQKVFQASRSTYFCSKCQR